MAKKIDLSKAKIPKHIAIVQDGNRRWARKEGLPIAEGHKAGAENAARIINHCQELGVKHVTLYALSTENWRRRAKKEVEGIFELLMGIVKEKKEEYRKKGVKLAVLGNFQAFPLKVRRAILEMLKIVKKHERIKCHIALNYGGREEIIRAIQNMMKDGIKPEEVNEGLMDRYLYTKDAPDPDLVIRTGGELRLSNFLLWQMSYAELYFTDTLWPDFGPEELEKAILEYNRRRRRFGK